MTSPRRTQSSFTQRIKNWTQKHPVATGLIIFALGAATGLALPSLIIAAKTTHTLVISGIAIGLGIAVIIRKRIHRFIQSRKNVTTTTHRLQASLHQEKKKNAFDVQESTSKIPQAAEEKSEASFDAHRKSMSGEEAHSETLYYRHHPKSHHSMDEQAKASYSAHEKNDHSKMDADPKASESFHEKSNHSEAENARKSESVHEKSYRGDEKISRQESDKKMQKTKSGPGL